MQFVFNVLNKSLGVCSGNAFQTAHAGRNRAFADDVEIADISGFFDMGTAA